MPSLNDMSPADRDLMIRTVYGEAGREPVMGQVAVAHSILNRMESGRYGGKTVPDVVLSRNQYEPWSVRAHELMSLRRDSPQYQNIAKVVDAAANGDVADPTGGATHFLNPNTVRQRRGGSLPAWTSGGSTVEIGGHSFYAPDGRVKRETADPIQAINAAIGAHTSPSTTGMAYADDGATPVKAGAAGKTAEAGSLFRDAGFTLPSAAPATQSPQAASSPQAEPVAQPGSLFTSAGFTLPGSKAVEPVTSTAGSAAPTPENSAALAQKYGVNVEPKPFLERLESAVNPVDVIKDVGGNILQKSNEYYQAAKGPLSQGWEDIKANRPASGLANIAQGVLGMGAAPINATANVLAEQPAAKIGGPEFGEKVGLLAGAAIPVPGSGIAKAAGESAAEVAKLTTPSSRAINEIVNHVGAENIPDVIKNVQSNPRLSLMDSSDALRTRGQGLAADAEQPKAQKIVQDAIKQREASLPSAVDASYTKHLGESPDPVKLLKSIEDHAKNIGEKEIQPAIRNAKPVDVTPVIEHIDKIVAPGVQQFAKSGLPYSDTEKELLKLRAKLTTGNENAFDAKTLHEIQSATGREAFELSTSANKGDHRIGRALRDANEKLVNQIDSASGGAYRPAREKYNQAMKIQDAFESGFETLQNRPGVKGLVDRPQSLDEWMKNATKEQIKARQLGTLLDIDQKLNGVTNKLRSGTNVTKVEYNREKLASLFGEKKASKLLRDMEHIQEEAITNSRIIHGSKTAETQSALAANKPRSISGLSPNALVSLGLPLIGNMADTALGASAFLNVPGAGAILGGAGTAAILASQKIGRMHDIAKNVDIAKRISATAGPVRKETINALMAHHEVRKELQRRRRNALVSP